MTILMVQLFYFDSEAAATPDLFRDRGLDPNRVWHFPIDTIEEFSYSDDTYSRQSP